MSKKPKTKPSDAIPNARALRLSMPTAYPMSAAEAMAFGRLLEQRAAIDRALEDVGVQAKARLGLAVEAKVEVDVGAAVYRVRA